MLELPDTYHKEQEPVSSLAMYRFSPASQVLVFMSQYLLRAHLILLEHASAVIVWATIRRSHLGQPSSTLLYSITFL